MSHQQLDQHFKDKLSNFTVSVPDDGWSLFEQKQKAQSFDASITEKISGLTAPLGADSWQQFEDHQNAQSLDNIIDNKLHQLTAMGSGNWDEFSSKLEQHNLPIEEQFDQIIAQSINNPYQAKLSLPHWQFMASRIEWEIVYPQEIKKIKLAELALLLLFFIYFGQYLPSYSTPTTSKSSIAAAASPIEKETTSIIETKSNTTSSQSTIINNQTPNTPKKTITKRITEITASTQLLKTATTAPSIPTLNARIDDVERKIPPAYTIVPTIDNATLDLLSSTPDEALNHKAKLHSKPKTQWRFSLLGALDYNRIITPITSIDDGTMVGWDRFDRGYSQGIMLGMKQNRLEYELGFVYSAINYIPLQVLYLEGSVQEGFYGEAYKYFEYNTIQLPFDLSYDYIAYRNWRMYVKGGVAWHTALLSNFYVADQTEFRSGKFQPQANINKDDYSREGDLTDELTLGAFEGGDILENSYISANMGLGIEYYISGRSSIFGQSHYGYSFHYFNKGLGPYKDVLHNFRIAMGVKVHLK